MLRVLLFFILITAASAPVVSQTPSTHAQQSEPKTYRPGDRIVFTVHLDGADAKAFKFSSASLALLGVVPTEEIAASALAAPTVSISSPGVYQIAFQVGQYVYPGDYGLSVTFETSDGTLTLPWDSQSAGIATPVHIVNVRRLQRPVVLVEGLRNDKTADLPGPAPTGAASKITPADVAYMQGMIMHHGQAVSMCDLVRSHTANPRIQELGRRIGIPQSREIVLMRDWLRSRGQSTQMAMPEAMPGMPDMDTSGKPMPSMPGMLSPAQMDALGHARGSDFDRLFLAGMIQHHSGALVMTDTLFASPGGGLEPELYLFAKHVVMVQEKEIGLMQSMQQDLGTQVTAGLARTSL